MLDIFPSRAIGPFGRRQRQARGGRIPVIVITGFLGAGKTTLVRNFLATPEGAGTAIVVNEFGEEGIDDALLRTSTDQVALLGNGCMCCTSRTDLQATLRDLVADRERGRIPHFKRVIIETSGLADPGPVLQTFGTDRGLGAEYHLEQSVALADAVNGAATLDWSSEARKQVILADRLIVTKTDLADAAAVRALQARLRELNALAPIGAANDGVTDWAGITEAPLVEWPANDPHGGARGFVAEADHSDNVGSFLFTPHGPAAMAVVHPRARRADHAARAGPAARQGLRRGGGLPRPGAGAGGAASRQRAGGAGGLAGR